MDSGRRMADQTAQALSAPAQRPIFWVGTVTALVAPHVQVRPDGATTAMTQLIAYPKGASPAVNDRVVGCWVDGEPFILAIVNS